MSVTMAAPAWAAQTYRDVPPSHWAYEAVEEMSQQGIFNGVGDGNFAPAKTVSRAEFITMVVRQFFPAFEDDWSAETPRWWSPMPTWPWRRACWKTSGSPLPTTTAPGTAR